jgi:putative sugar O-methyltransferase
VTAPRVLDDAGRERIRSLRGRIVAMLEERRSLPGASPSRYWSDFCETFDYMLGLPEDSFLKLRIHTYHLTGDNYQTYYFGDAEAFRAVHSLDHYTADIPDEFVLDEPPGGIGFTYSSGRVVSLDSLRYQRVVNTLVRHADLRTLSAKAPSILEIGGGYGGLAHHLSRLCPGSRYVIVDIPETLLFSSTYLTLQNPGKKLYLYDPTDFEQVLQPGQRAAYDFVLLPDYRLDALRDMRFDLAINQASLQEMRAEQVRRYLDFVRDTCEGVFYSWNQDHQPRNAELGNLTELIRERFDITPVPEWTPPRTTRSRVRQAARTVLRDAARALHLVDRPVGAPDRLPYREYLCRPRRERAAAGATAQR